MRHPVLQRRSREFPTDDVDFQVRIGQRELLQQRRLNKKRERAIAAETQADTEERAPSNDETVRLKVFQYDPDIETKQ